MQLGVYLNRPDADLDTQIELVREAEAAGFRSAFFSQLTSWDAISVAGLAGREVPGIEVGTAVVQTYAKHPLALAGQALTAQAISGNSFTLGLGPSHREIIEGTFGLDYDRPARHVREYLSALMPLLRGEAVDYRGETLSVTGRVEVPGAAAPPVLLSALGPVMLRIAGELADGTVTVWTGAQAVAEHIVPRITEAASAAGRPSPRVVASVMVAVTNDPEGVRRRIAEQFGFAGNFAGYRAMLERQGMSGIHETVIAGSESAVEKEIERYEVAGATDLLLSAVGDEEDQARTLAFLTRVAA
ncbi:LLM class F420-dependent oxidoreductase [Nonomuraea zeae]|uniref:LLM class F420-dependent oxidoreductase n=1 Tax=Nonomuraea zeae TaxID=1642303 RepID=A0A5S4FA29_9ACTN|nr:LLM class F420-dependent oxidoreductase [Nonomuraea zeae]TMR13939.1 LLM class F420-dependent oxidoreductase [Nonomuraea zeae]